MTVAQLPLFPRSGSLKIQYTLVVLLTVLSQYLLSILFAKHPPTSITHFQKINVVVGQPCPLGDGSALEAM